MILVDWDGLDAAFLQRGYDLPNIQALIARGSLSTANSTFTTFSNPGRASLSTGAYPATHHNVAWTFDPTANVVLGQTRRLETESIAEALARGGVSAASVQWYMVQDHGVAFGDPSHLYVQPGGEFGNRVDVAIDILNRRPVNSGGSSVTVPAIPRFLAVYSSEPDAVVHEGGTHSSQLQSTLQQQDADLGRLIQATRDVGIFDRTTFVLTADHGMTDWTQTALPVLRQAITDAGYTNEAVFSGDSPSSSTEVVIAPAVRVAHLTLRGDAATPTGRTAIRNAVAARPEVSAVLGSAELAALHASSEMGDFVVEAQPPWSFALNNPPAGVTRAAHGSRAEFGVPLLLSGASVASTPPSSPGLVDVAPTVAALLGAPCPAGSVGQGRVLVESLTGPASCG